MVRDAGSFVVLLPVKSPGAGKSRLAALRDAERSALAAAFAADVVSACLMAPEVADVLVISDDAAFAATLTDTLFCPDPGQGLNAALRHGASVVRATQQRLRPAALCADLPALASTDLSAALTSAADQAGPCFVEDADRSGTTLYTAGYDDFDPHFGPESATAHRTVGAFALPGALPTLRRDVDDIRDLVAAVDLGVGAATTQALKSIDLPLRAS